nr:hypothetical protein [Actinomycetota bacterium]
QRWMHLVPDPLANVAVRRRVPFVALVIAMLGLGLIATLWLSTNAAEGSYQLSSAQKESNLLAEKAEALHRDVATMNSAAALARRATDLGMVPTTDVARLVVAPGGAVTVVGKPAPAAPQATPAPATAAPNPAAPTSAVPKPVPAAGAPTQPAPSAQAHSEQIQPGPVPVPARGGA